MSRLKDLFKKSTNESAKTEEINEAQFGPSVPEGLWVKCPKCGEGTIVERKSKRGTVFYGCDKYPNCDFTLWNEPTGEKCPECGSLLVKKTMKKGDVIACSNIKCGYKKECEQPENAGE